MLKNESGKWHAIDYKEVLENFESSLQGLELEEVNETVLLSALEGKTAAVNCKVLETSRLVFVGSIEIPDTGITSFVSGFVVKFHAEEKLLFPASLVELTLQ